MWPATIQIMDGLESNMDFGRTRKSYIGLAESDITESVKNPYWTTEPSINFYIMPKNSLYSMFLVHFWWILHDVVTLCSVASRRYDVTSLQQA
jgi:hypothetical protein